MTLTKHTVYNVSMTHNDNNPISRMEVLSPTQIKVVGYCNEKMAMKGILDKLNLNDLVIFDLAELRTMNSFGLRNFLQFIEKIPNFSYQNCPPVFLDQINMLPALLGKSFDLSRIHSLRLDFICEEHRQELTKVFQAPILPGTVKMTAPFCPKQEHKISEKMPKRMTAKQHLESLLYCFGQEFAEEISKLKAQQHQPLHLAGLRHDLKHRLAVLQDKEPKNQIFWQNLHQLIDTLEDQVQQNSPDMSLEQLMWGLKEEIGLRAEQEKKILHWPGHVPHLVLTPQLGIALKRILLNLLQNSTVYANSYVRFTVQQVPELGLQIKISDDGPILPEETQDLLKSHQAPDHKYAIDGRGLGLKTCHYLSLQIKATLAYERLEPSNVFSLNLLTQPPEEKIARTFSRLLICCEKEEYRIRWTQITQELSRAEFERFKFDTIRPAEIALIDLSPYLSIYTDQGELASEALSQGIPVLWAPTFKNDEDLLRQVKRIL